ncbi:hypothetical protein ACQPWY_26385 [Pseudonocardia xinjiangensis]|uniref:hypothetical protein n=1 Tax=Pseudonocardia xinjiangensis TaxID=75289 RepID=UPI003D8EB59F
MISRHKRNEMDESDSRMPPTATIVVPSRVPGADFLARLYAQWSTVDEDTLDQQWQHHARLIALDHLRAVTERWTMTRLVHHYAAAEVAINGELATPLVVEQPIEAVINGWVRLAPASESDSATEKYLVSMRGERARNDQARDRLDFYHYVFADRERAWLWWVDQQPEKLQALPFDSFAAIIDTLETTRTQQGATSNAQDVDSFAQVIGDFITNLKPDHSALAIGLLRQYLKHFDQTELVARVDLLSTSAEHEATKEGENLDRDGPAD